MAHTRLPFSSLPGIQAVTEQKRAWQEAQERLRGQQQLVGWPQHLIEHFFVVVSGVDVLPCGYVVLMSTASL